MRIAGLRAAGSVRARRDRDPRGDARAGASRPRSRGRRRPAAVQVVPRGTRAAGGAPLADARPRGGAGAPGRPRHRDEVPLLRDPPSEQGRLARAPVPPGLRARPGRAGAVRGEVVRPRDGSGGPPARSSRLSAKRSACSRSRRTSPTGCERSTGLDAEVLPPPPQQLDYRAPDGDGEYILSVGRLDRAKRVDLLLEAAALDGSLRVVVAGEGPDRERLERSGVAAPPGRARHLRRPGGGRRARRPVCQSAWRSSTHRSTRISASFRMRRSCRRSLW